MIRFRIGDVAEKHCVWSYFGMHVCWMWSTSKCSKSFLFEMWSVIFCKYANTRTITKCKHVIVLELSKNSRGDCLLGLVFEEWWVGRTLVDMYARCGILAKAKVHEEFPVQDVMFRITFMTGYVQRKQDNEDIQREDISPDQTTLILERLYHQKGNWKRETKPL